MIPLCVKETLQPFPGDRIGILIVGATFVQAKKDED
jgi:hypothetical protein